ncbi:hypothetical protein CTAM01_10680 [Colletotrichum tamarilloi]|uniref:Uncharacterized protein n=1 Tax=Colletotrichum tamarilloi TaxID=1209934 RepID=A0ABQ9QZR0_9PEZI|nr:uncharacterized protein CTAM01_10680 [Colletotrichum tamarilloi]KAK1490391.1 hypothetical protein CTAM01_10680 [Colletotrichum tamarilloi]
MHSQDTKPAGTSGREKREPMPRRNEDNVHYFAFPRHSAPIAGCNDAIRSPFSCPEFRPDLPVLLLRFGLEIDSLSALVNRHMQPAVSPKQTGKVPYLARADGPPKSLCQATGQAGEGVCSLSIKYQLVNVARHGDHGPSSKVENMAYSR